MAALRPLRLRATPLGGGRDTAGPAAAGDILTARGRWAVFAGISAGVVGLAVVLVVEDAAIYHLIVRLYKDPLFLRETLEQRGVLAPILFMLIQALQVVISPIPGEATGFLGGYLFGQWLGLLYSTAGLGLGSVTAFAIGRSLGTRWVQGMVSDEAWRRLGFIVEAEGAILCFIIYLIPGLPKDIICYLFGISPMPVWVFALVSTLGRIPGTWVLSAQGANTAAGHYVYVVLITALVVAAALPLYYYRYRIVRWLRGRAAGPNGGYAGGLDRDDRQP